MGSCVGAAALGANVVGLADGAGVGGGFGDTDGKLLGRGDGAAVGTGEVGPCVGAPEVGGTVVGGAVGAGDGHHVGWDVTGLWVPISTQ